ncbi:hypothetical protein [Aestuariivirga sp.]|uniref:hypothetical protein n=1 Tax=Aestuariivirga sp. TaxID=2650926 RepID=UPI003BACAA1D
MKFPAVWEIGLLILGLIALAIPLRVSTWTPNEWGAILAGVGSLLQAVAIGSAAYVGHVGFEQWRRQRIEERRIATAERILSVAYRVQDAFDTIRAPFISNEEFQAAEDDLRRRETIDSSTPSDAVRAQVRAQGAMNRVNRFAEVWSTLHETVPVARAVFGSGVETLLRDLLRQRNKLVSSVRIYAKTGDPKVRAIFWLGQSLLSDDMDDQFENEVDDAVKKLETQLQPILTIKQKML